MCATCGCSPPDSPNNNHGNRSNLTLRDLEIAGKTKAAGQVGASGAVKNANRTLRKRK